MLYNCISLFVVLFLGATNAFLNHNIPKTVLKQTSSLFAVTEIGSSEEFDAAVKDGPELVVIDYSTTWCGPCKLVLPKFIALSDKYLTVKFLKCIGDATPTASLLMKREGIRSVPAFHFWKNGERLDTVNGAKIDEVEERVKEFSA